jgi:DNA-directed RNA polymerase specialized sigma24 family protein
MGELWSAYGGQVWRAMLAASAGRTDLADDVTQEAFARLIVYRETVHDPLAWLFSTRTTAPTRIRNRMQWHRTAASPPAPPQ